jgi:predicted kinase
MLARAPRGRKAAHTHPGVRETALLLASEMRTGRKCSVALPLLVVVSGPPGSGKSTLAYALARAIPCPAISSDEIKEGLVHALDAYTPAQGDELQRRTNHVFFSTIGALIDARVSLVAEAAFQHRLWAPGLTPLLDRARIHVVRCQVDPAVAWERINRRAGQLPARRAVHGDPSLDEPFERFAAKLAGFDAVALPVPTIDVDTSGPIDAGLEAALRFLGRVEVSPK